MWVLSWVLISPIPFFSGALPSEGLSMDGLAPIGTERAQKTSAAPPYAVLTPGHTQYTCTWTCNRF